MKDQGGTEVASLNIIEMQDHSKSITFRNNKVEFRSCCLRFQEQTSYLSDWDSCSILRLEAILAY
jgi:hypothetical protein